MFDWMFVQNLIYETYYVPILFAHEGQIVTSRPNIVN